MSNENHPVKYLCGTMTYSLSSPLEVQGKPATEMEKQNFIRAALAQFMFENQLTHVNLWLDPFAIVKDILKEKGEAHEKH